MFSRISSNGKKPCAGQRSSLWPCLLSVGLMYVYMPAVDPSRTYIFTRGEREGRTHASSGRRKREREEKKKKALFAYLITVKENGKRVEARDKRMIYVFSLPPSLAAVKGRRGARERERAKEDEQIEPVAAVTSHSSLVIHQVSVGGAKQREVFSAKSPLMIK